MKNPERIAHRLFHKTSILVPLRDRSRFTCKAGLTLTGPEPTMQPGGQAHV